MGIVAILEVDGRPVSLLDPTGGEFNAAGDFDRLLPFDSTTPLLCRLEPDDEVVFANHELEHLAEEVNLILDWAEPGPARRGLIRLQALARQGSMTPDAVLRASGD